VIVRIQGEGQYDLEGEALQALKEADRQLMDAVVAGDEQAFHERFSAVLRLVRERGTPVPPERLVESDLVLPAADMSLEEARRLFTSPKA
jgi:hypothetical protein